MRSGGYSNTRISLRKITIVLYLTIELSLFSIINYIFKLFFPKMWFIKFVKLPSYPIVFMCNMILKLHDAVAHHSSRTLRWEGSYSLALVISMLNSRKRKEMAWLRTAAIVQMCSHVWLFVSPWAVVRQASLSFTISQSLLTFMSVE